MSTSYCRMLPFLLLFCINAARAQDHHFRKVLNSITGQPSDLKQDQQGIIWIGTFDQGLKRYDGINLKTYVNDPAKSNSLSSNVILSIAITKDKMIWLGIAGTGLDKFDPIANTFTNFRHDPKNPNSLSSDTVSAILEDRSGNLWVATNHGLDLMDRKTGTFTHYYHDKNDPSSISNNEVYKIYEDKQGDIWVGCWPFAAEEFPGNGGLNRLDRKTGKFTRFLYDAAKPNGLPDNRVIQIYEDKDNNFWIGTFPDGLSKMDRKTGEFQRYYPDPQHNGSLEKVKPVRSLVPFISFLTEDKSGAFWVGLGNSGMNRYDPATKGSTHYGFTVEGSGKVVSAADTSKGFTSRDAFVALSTMDGLFWVCSVDGALYNLNYNKTTVPFYTTPQDQANSFYYDDNSGKLWIATGNGLVRRDISTKTDRVWMNDPKNNNSLPFNRISSIRMDKDGFLWLGTRGGLSRFDPRTEKFSNYKYDRTKPSGISSDNLNYLFIDHQENLWMASDSGISRMEKATGLFKHYKPAAKDSTRLYGYNFLCIVEDRDHYLWVASDYGPFRLNTKTGKFRKYNPNIFIKSLCVDAKGTVWAGGDLGLYYLDKPSDQFVLFADQYSAVSISAIINIIEDDKRNLWVSTATSLLRISEDRKKIKRYTAANGIRFSNFFYNDNFKAKDGRLFLGEIKGYYMFHPEQLSDKSEVPGLVLSGFRLRNTDVQVEKGGLLSAPLWETEEIRLRYNQNVFSFEFFAIDYISPGDEKYLYMLENFDDTWRDIGGDRRATFYNVQPGRYTFRVKVISGDGSSVEKSVNIVITPPWWKTWWAYSLYVLLAIVAGFFIYRFQKRAIIRKERERTQQKELLQAREMEKAYTELKTTQAQLIQSEKMASLGELTAGIAHEIQNPLNFVNNFSEVNKELIAEMNDELAKGNLEAVKLIAKDITENEEKINHHGKRADGIVKGMLQHSRSSSGKKEPADINALCEEYLRLSYHGLRAKDKAFNATLKTDFDQGIGRININAQDMGRVVLNLINNAFYAVNQKNREGKPGYEPTVMVTTKAKGKTVEITVADNGNGIPQDIYDKIFQPFFTTKPTGEGTGLGLSLSYDIVTKGHAGSLKAETVPGEGSTFIISLPANPQI